MSEHMREEFESRFKTKSLLAKDSVGEYKDLRMKALWLGYSDRAEIAAKREAELLAEMERLKQGEPVQEWLPIEMIPKTGEIVLLAVLVTHCKYLEDGGVVDAQSYELDFGSWNFAKKSAENNGGESLGGSPQPTHWMPLPAAPKPEAT